MLQAVDRVIARIGAVALSPRWVFAIWGFILLLVFVMRAYFFTGADADDAEQLICMQNWALACGPRNPPLFTWLGLLVQPLFGQNFASVVFVKFAVMAAFLYLLYLSSVQILKDRSLAALVTLSPIAIYYFAWDAFFHYTHSILVVFALCLSLYLLLRLERGPTLAGYLLFGLSIAAGALSKFNYLLFLFALLVAAVTDRDMRRIVFDTRMLAALVLGAVLAAPYYVWLWRHRDWAVALARDRFTPGVATTTLVDFSGLGDLFSALLNFALPLALFLVLLFPRALGPAGARAAPSARYRRMLEITLGIILALTIVGVIALGASRIRAHYMFILILFPLLYIARVQAAGASERARNVYATVLVALALIVPSAILVKYAVDPLRGRKAYYHMPYAELSAALQRAGFVRGTIVGDSQGYPLAGNFLPYFPDSRIINLLDWQLDMPDDITPGQTLPVLSDDAQGQCLVLWRPDVHSGRKDVVIRRTNRLLGTALTTHMPTQRISAEFHNGGGRVFTVEFILLPGRGRCR